MNSSSWRGWLVASCIFLLGVAIGGAGTLWLGGRAVRRAIQTGSGAPAGLTERAATRIGEDLQRNLNLSSDEAERVQSILDETARNLRALRRDAFREAAVELRTSIRKIAAELPPEKRDDFRRIVVRRYERLGLRPPGRVPDAPEPE